MKYLAASSGVLNSSFAINFNYRQLQYLLKAAVSFRRKAYLYFDESQDMLWLSK